VAVAILAWWAAREPEAPAAGVVSVAAVGSHSQASAGDVGNVITDARHATVHLHASNHSSPIPAAAAEHPSAIAIVGDVPQQPPAFQPRVMLLASLHQHTSPGITVIHAVTGMIGTGKTQAAAAYARQCIRDKWRLVAWINAENAADILNGLAQAALAFGLPQGRDQVATALSLRRYLEADGQRCLVVFDNAVDPAQLRPYLPAAGDASIIITSTHGPISSLGTSVSVGVFTDSEALAYLNERTGINDSIGARQLAAALGHLPLALAQAAAHIADQRITYGAYLAELASFPLVRSLTHTSQDPCPRSVTSAIALAVQTALSSDPTELASHLIDLVALLAPAGINRGLLQTAAQVSHGPRSGIHRRIRAVNASPSDVNAALAHLHAASLITFSLDGTTVAAHRLTARIIREQQSHTGTLLAAAAIAIGVLQQATTTLSPPWLHAQDAKELIQHITALHTHLAGVPGRSAAVLEQDLFELRCWAMDCFAELKETPTAAITFGQSLISDSERLFGTDHPRTLTSRHDLATAYLDAGQTREAITLHEKNLADRSRILGDDHQDTLKSRNNLANAYQQAGRTNEAIVLFEINLSDHERILGTDHPNALVARNNLAGAYAVAGRTDEAIALHEKNLAARERILGTDHPHTLVSRNNLAGAYVDAGRISDGIDLHERTLSDRERILGGIHPQTLTSRNDLAKAYLESGQIDKAVALLEEALAERERILGPSHPDTLSSRNYLSSAYLQSQKASKRITQPGASSLYSLTHARRWSSFNFSILRRRHLL
jgi:tetratricopeptide (TPR) repeat protein